ncbi:MAG: DUF6057 family protein [Parabacteroides sp.]|nr:DUF6057 family protein [Parabacteroides sp.]
MDKREKLFREIVTGVFVLSCVIFFQFFYSDHLFLKEEVVSFNNLPETLSGYLGKPAWLACSLAKILSSAFVPGGAFLIAVVLMLEWWASFLVLRKFHVGGGMAPLFALFPVVLEWGTYCSPFYHLSSILSLTVTLYVFLGYTLLKKRWLSCLAGFVLLFVVYSLVGSRLFIFVILVLLYEAEIGGGKMVLLGFVVDNRHVITGILERLVFHFTGICLPISACMASGIFPGYHAGIRAGCHTV